MIRYRLDVADVHAHLFRVTITVAQPAAEQVLSLPVWIPGSYLVREFARHLSRFEARQGERAVEWRQLDKASWQFQCTGRGALRVSYEVYAFDTSVRAAYLDAQRGFFNGTSVFLRVHGREDDPHRFSIGGLPRGWQVATAAPADEDGWLCADYHELIDHPVELGAFWRGRFVAAGVPHEFVVAGALPGFDSERLLADTQKICEQQIAFWHGRRKPLVNVERGRGGARAGKGTPPFGRYLFLLNCSDDGHGGLEHRASTALLASRRDLPRLGSKLGAEGYVGLLGLISHEYFHTWNVKRLKPREFTSFDYTRENYTELLWFFEGFTSYYDDLMLRRCGLIDDARYLKLLAKTVNQVLGTPGRKLQSVAAASFDAWVKYYRPDENTLNATVSYYSKGALVALALDLALRSERSGGEPPGAGADDAHGASLDEVMRRLWSRGAASGEEAGGGGPIGEASIAAALAEVGGRSFARELAAWVHGTSELPLKTLFARFGIGWAEEPATIAQRLGARVAEAGGVLKLQSVLRGGAAESAGLAAGDELLALDGWRLKRVDDLPALRAFERPLPLIAARDGRVLQLTLPAAQAAGGVALALEPQADAPTQERRARWLGGAA
ncbi:MAG TPA: peptidase M61 [Methylibium sp.]|uniref:M61 family metallopeptidase n=1 Tax=Methylibium sp. TaxID=2067992 RepID=UPI002DBAF1F1|nr:peptidase M61 [Methylibium sp.]HEU4460751.1 peptidase M61 [Methylibium sp.]